MPCFGAFVMPCFGAFVMRQHLISAFPNAPSTYKIKFLTNYLQSSENLYIFAARKKIMGSLSHQEVIDRIKQVAERVLPKGSTLYLYGSRARGDFNEESDWDLLVLLDKPERDIKDWDNYAWPFTEMGWDIEEDISARTFTKEQWYNGPHTMFYFNVEEDKKILYES